MVSLYKGHYFIVHASSIDTVNNAVDIILLKTYTITKYKTIDVIKYNMYILCY